jgi:hypothetical protein
MSVLETLVTQLMILMRSDICDLTSLTYELRDPAWARRRHSKTALEILLNRWCDEAMTNLIDDLLLLTTPPKWAEWIKAEEGKGVRVDIWKSKRDMIGQGSKVQTYPQKLVLLGLWIGEEKAETISSELYPCRR